MSVEAAVFWLAALTVGSAVVVVLARSLIYSAFALLFTFLGVAGFYLLLGADFLATTQLLIYVGGILVLLLFGDAHPQALRPRAALRGDPVRPQPGGRGDRRLRPAGYDRDAHQWAAGDGRAPAPTTSEIGRLFMGPFILPFEAASILLLVALMGAALIVRRKKDA